MIFCLGKREKIVNAVVTAQIDSTSWPIGPIMPNGSQRIAEGKSRVKGQTRLGGNPGRDLIVFKETLSRR